MTSQSIQNTARLATTAAARRGMTTRALIPFLVIAFGLAWGLIALAMLFPVQVEAIAGPIGYTNPLFLLAVYAPGIGGLFLVVWHYGLRGLVSYLRRFTLWRMSWPWWALLIVGIPAVKYLGALLNDRIFDPFPFSPWYTVLPALLTTLLIGPMEEVGWRGVALPLLQRRFAPLWAGLILGGLWALWHVPAFFLGGTPQSAWALGPYVLGVLAVGFLLTPIFNAARGSLLVAALYHFQMNGPAWPEAQPWENYLFALLAVAIVVVNRKAMLDRAGAPNEVLFPGDELPAA
jgi:membrane protease YdiL (CAAX protease family)